MLEAGMGETWRGINNEIWSLAFIKFSQMCPEGPLNFSTFLTVYN
jgi:hypothetical protein